MNKDKIFFDDIGIIRSFCIICILIGHSFAIYSGSSYWTLPTNVDNINFYKWINPLFTSIQLQTFVFISGFLFSHQQINKTYKTSDYIIKKVKRILLPCVFFGIIYYLSIDRYKLGNVSIKYFLSGAGHLWFLPMIFCCYSISKLFWNLIKKPSIITFFIISLLSIFSLYIPQLICIQNFATYFIYFILGVWCYNYKNKILNLLQNHNIGIYLLLTIIILAITRCYIYYNRSFQGADVLLHSFRYLLGITGGIASLYLANLEKINKKIPTKISQWNGWYGVYIYHQFILMYFYYNLPIYSINKYILPFIAFIISFIVSVLLVELTLKTKVGRWLIG